MDLNNFDETYGAYKSAEKITIRCDHPKCVAGDITIGKQPARRNILKNGGEKFICRDCCMKYDNPMNKVGESRQTDESIEVVCSECQKTRQMKKTCYYGSMTQPYQQICGSCAQKGKSISDDTKEKIRSKLKGKELSPEHVAKILEYRKNNPEWAEKAKKNLIPGMGGIARKGLPLPQEWRNAISDGTSGKRKTLNHKLNISEGRKKMLKENGGFSKEHRENLSKATVRQYQNGFEPKMFHMTGYHYSDKVPNGQVYYASSYEKQAFELLDADSSVKSYAKESIVIPYFHPVKEIQSNYLVDLEVFYEDGSRKIIEVKPRKWINPSSERGDIKVVMAKIKAAEEYSVQNNVPFEIWDEEVLFGEKSVRTIPIFTRNLKLKELMSLVKQHVEGNFGNGVIDYEISPFGIVDDDLAVWVVNKGPDDELNLDLLLMIRKKNNWYSKVISETETPVATDCPKRLLQMTPKEKCSSYNEYWRELCELNDLVS